MFSSGLQNNNELSSSDGLKQPVTETNNYAFQSRIYKSPTTLLKIWINFNPSMDKL